MGLRIMLVSENSDHAATLARVLEHSGFDVVESAVGAELAEQVGLTGAELVVTEVDKPDHVLLESIRRMSTSAPRPVVLFTRSADRELMEEATQAGVNAYVVNGIDEKRIKPIIDVALVRFKQLCQVQNELIKSRESLAERKIVERAKGLLMKQKRCSEHDAYHLLRKMAMKRNARLADVAQSLVSIEELLT